MWGRAVPINRLHEIDTGIWTLDGDPISFLTFPYQIRSTIMDTGSGSLFVHSPVQLAAWTESGGLPGTVEYLVSPNKLHHMFLPEWKEAFPQARLFTPPGLREKLPELQVFDELTDTAEPDWAEVVEQKVVRGSWFMSEVVFFHKPSRTLILGDLIENHDPDCFGVLHRAIGRINAMLAPNGSTPRNYRASFLRRKEAREDFRHILEWNPQRVVMSHGPIVEVQAQQFLRNAFQWAL